MSVTETTSATSATSATGALTAATGTTDLGEDTFLRLLTTQMQNQDPLEPMSNEEFVAQLAQFSSLEELHGISDALEATYLLNASMNNAQMVNLIGQQVTANGDNFVYPGVGSQEIHFDAAEATTSTTVEITDADGTVVWSGEIGAVAEGEGTWTWDGTTSDGTSAPGGTYTFSVTGTNASEETVDVAERIVGVVDEMDFSTGSAQPTVGGVAIEVGDILSIATAPAPQ